jgi:hypothetical protein
MTFDPEIKKMKPVPPNGNGGNGEKTRNIA